jgi:hypothetical protein
MIRILRSLLCFVIFLGALAATAKMLNNIAPFAEVPLLRDKWAYWQEHKDEFDTLFIGTSRTIRGIMPSVFDRLTTQAGVPTHSYNFGIDGMFPPEDAYVAERIFATKPKNLRWVFIEMGVFLGDFEGRPAKSVRSVHWHDWTRTWLCIREKFWPKKRKTKWKKWFESDKGEPSDASVAMTHLEVFLFQSLNIGRGANAWARLALQRPIKPDEFGQTLDGFLPMPEAGILKGKTLEQYQKELAERKITPARVVPLRPYSQESFDRMNRLARAAGAQVIFLVAPTTGELSGQPDAASQVPCFDYRNLQKYPDLFELGARADTAHMSPKGAELYTQHVAENFIELNQNRK